MLSIKNKIRKALGMKPVSENRLDKSGEGTVTDYFPDFSVKQVREYRRGGELIYSSDYGKDEICKNFYTAGKLKSVTTISKETGARTSKTTYYHDGRRTVGSFENDKQIGSTDYFPDGHQIVTTFSKERGAKTGRTTSYPDGRQTVDIFEKGKQVGATDYFPDDSKIVSEFLDDDDHSYGEENYHGLCYRTKINADGSIAYKDRLYDYGIGPVTSVFSEESRKTAYIAAYVNGYRLGDAIGLGHAHDPAQTAESVRQNTLYNAACNAIWHGDQKETGSDYRAGFKTKKNCLTIRSFKAC